MHRPGREETPIGPLDVVNKCSQPLHEYIGARGESESKKKTTSSHVPTEQCVHRDCRVRGTKPNGFQLHSRVLDPKERRIALNCRTRGQYVRSDIWWYSLTSMQEGVGGAATTKTGTMTAQKGGGQLAPSPRR